MKNTLQFIGSFHQGGSERQAVQLARLLQADARVNVSLATLENAGVLRAEVEKLDLQEIPEFKLTSFYNLNFVKQLIKCANFLRAGKIDIIHTHDFYTNIFGMLAAHELPIEDESVDVVFGMAILHHLDLQLASAEVFRVLKKGGRAIFLEPVRNSRLVRFVRNMIPYESPDVSPFERPLTDAELETFAARFSKYRSRAFSILFVNLVNVLGLPESLLHRAIRLDGKILKAAPFLRNYASVRVVEMTK